MVHMAQGVDERPVVTEHEVKSVSQETTFSRDLVSSDALRQQLWKLSQGVGRRLERKGLAATTVAVKLRYSDFATLTRQMRLGVSTDDEEEIVQMLAHDAGGTEVHEHLQRQ